MNQITRTSFPRLRYVETLPVVHHDQPFLLLRDPLQLSDRVVLVPADLAPALGLFDGTNEFKDMQDILADGYNYHVAQPDLDELMDTLDAAYLIENDRSKAAMTEKLEDFRRAPCRPANLAGSSYPQQSDDLSRLLDGYIDRAGSTDPVNAGIRGLISPHIDYPRGWRVYAQGWESAREAARSAELVVILGTDHYGPDRYLTLTRQHYATPFGVLKTPRELVDSLADAIGPSVAFAGELYHRGEHSIELAAVWLHHIRRGESCEMLPILCGSFLPYWNGTENIEDDEFLADAIEVLREIVNQRKTLIVAAADLSHVGPTFGGKALELPDHARLKLEDEQLIDSICHGDAETFLDIIMQSNDHNNVCGVAPIFLAMKILAPLQGSLLAYEHCPADDEHHSTVSVCSLLLH
jgi:AmmeMemoRadiSam system protein B